ncbi:MAG TPA: serine acetyltransferase [Bacteroidales bacterium]|nr:serine acetyltransferase [Bacteroidales bacterium]
MVNDFDKIIDEISLKGNEILINLAATGYVIMPSVTNLKIMVHTLREIFFPGYFDPCPLNHKTFKYYVGSKVNIIHNLLSEEIKKVFKVANNFNNKKNTFDKDYSQELSYEFIKVIPKIRDLLMTDVEAIFYGDPASKDNSEIIYCYPGIKAITNYRIAHELTLLDIPLIPRIITEMAHSETGIDIHPMAKIGDHFAIDHGTGIVIGETCIIGSNVKIYQGVTLGAKSFPVDEKGHPTKGIPRHPIVEDNVIIYSGATILGRITIGKNSIIGGNVWLTESIPANSKIVLMSKKL